MKVSELLNLIPDNCRVVITTKSGRVLKDCLEGDKKSIDAYSSFEIVYIKNSYYPRVRGGDSSCLSIAIKEIV